MIRAYGQKTMRQLRFPSPAVVVFHELARYFYGLGEDTPITVAHRTSEESTTFRGRQKTRQVAVPLVHQPTSNINRGLDLVDRACRHTGEAFPVYATSTMHLALVSRSCYQNRGCLQSQ